VRAAVRAREKASMTRAAAWLGVGQYAQVFARQSTAFAVISDLTEVDLEKPRIPLGPASALARSPAQVEPADIDQATIAPPRAERCQVTMLFCDLVGSTASGIHLRSAATCPLPLLAHADEVIE
jgi:hypothetical protein